MLGMGHFIFWPRNNQLFFGGGNNFKTRWRVAIPGHIQACPTRFLAQKTFVILKKRWPSNDSFLGRPACGAEITAIISPPYFFLAARKSKLSGAGAGITTRLLAPRDVCYIEEKVAK